MFTKSIRRTIAVFSAICILSPASAMAVPIYDHPQPEPVSTPAPTPLVERVDTDGAGQTLALVISSAALLVAAFSAARTTNVRRVA
jgi:hypothetical protein